VIIGGGFPELFAGELARNVDMRREIVRAAEGGLSILAECGGYMYLMKRLIDFEGCANEMCGVFGGQAVMRRSLQQVGYVTASAGRINFRAHEFHYSPQLSQNQLRNQTLN